jgi:hypothetical protein
VSTTPAANLPPVLLIPVVATAVVDTGGKFAAGIVDTGGRFATGVNSTRGTGGKICRRWLLIPVANLPPVSLIPVANLPPVSLIPVANLPPVSLTPVVHLDLRISPRIFEKIRNGPYGILWGWGELIHKKTRSKKSRDTVPLKFRLIQTRQFH